MSLITKLIVFYCDMNFPCYFEIKWQHRKQSESVYCILLLLPDESRKSKTFFQLIKKLTDTKRHLVGLVFQLLFFFKFSTLLCCQNKSDSWLSVVEMFTKWIHPAVSHSASTCGLQTSINISLSSSIKPVSVYCTLTQPNRH